MVETGNVTANNPIKEIVFDDCTSWNLLDNKKIPKVMYHKIKHRL